MLDVFGIGRVQPTSTHAYSGAVFVDPDGTTAILKGGTGNLKAKDIADIAGALLKAGFTHVQWRRKKATGWKDIIICLRDWKERKIKEIK